MSETERKGLARFFQINVQYFHGDKAFVISHFLIYTAVAFHAIWKCMKYDLVRIYWGYIGKPIYPFIISMIIILQLPAYYYLTGLYLKNVTPWQKRIYSNFFIKVITCFFNPFAWLVLEQIGEFPFIGIDTFFLTSLLIYIFYFAYDLICAPKDLKLRLLGTDFLGALCILFIFFSGHFKLIRCMDDMFFGGLLLIAAAASLFTMGFWVYICIRRNSGA